MDRLAGGVAVVTGGGSGIGEALAQRCDVTRRGDVEAVADAAFEHFDDEGMRTPAEVGARVLAAVRADHPYVITHPSWRPLVEARCRHLLLAVERAAEGVELS